MHFTMPVSKILTNRQIVDHYYVKTDKEHIFKCLCGAERKQKTENGYHNLISHLKSQHPGFENAIKMASNQQYTITDFVPTKITTIYSWLEWIIMEGREFSFSEKELVRKYCKLEPIARSSFMKYMDLVTKRVEEDIGKSQPTTYGLIIDGWSSGSTHYLSIFACSPRGCPLLAFSPLLNEEDLNAESHVNFISSTLLIFNSTIANVVYIVGDNCNLNKAITNMLGVPLIGKAVQKYKLDINICFDCDIL